MVASCLPPALPSWQLVGSGRLQIGRCQDMQGSAQAGPWPLPPRSWRYQHLHSRSCGLRLGNTATQRLPPGSWLCRAGQDTAASCILFIKTEHSAAPSRRFRHALVHMQATCRHHSSPDPWSRAPRLLGGLCWQPHPCSGTPFPAWWSSPHSGGCPPVLAAAQPHCAAVPAATSSSLAV